MNICFIGGGNMASALIGGLIKNGTPARNLRVVEIDDEGRRRLAQTGVQVFEAATRQAVEGCDVIVLAVKPQQLKAVAVQLGSWLQTGQIILSIAAGIRLTTLMKWLGTGNYTLVRAMPNTPALVGAGITGLCFYSFPSAQHLPENQRSQISSIMDSVGTSVWINSEDDMDAVTAISGSGPAYVFYFIEALAEAGVKLGLSKETAKKLALETFLGASKLAHESPEDPATLRARVTSKNGTTERALLSMEADNLKGIILKATETAALRSRELGDELDQ